MVCTSVVGKKIGIRLNSQSDVRNPIQISLFSHDTTDFDDHGCAIPYVVSKGKNYYQDWTGVWTGLEWNPKNTDGKY